MNYPAKSLKARLHTASAAQEFSRSGAWQLLSRWYGVQAECIAQSRNYAARRIRRLANLARARGYRAGLLQGMQQVLQDALTHHELYKNTVTKANQECLELSLRIAHEVAGEEFCVKHDALAKKIALRLEEISSANSVRVVVHTAQHSEICKALTAKFPKQIEICHDHNISPGTACIESPAGAIYLNWNEHFTKIEMNLRRKLNAVLPGGSGAAA